MASAELLLAFAVATIAYAAVPGPGTVYVAAQAIAHDPAAALRGALGLHLGGYAIVFASAAGLTALFAVVPVLYEGLKLLGAAYLVWLGWRLIFRPPAAEGVDPPERRLRRRPASFRQGVVVELLNPTTAIFYVAFLPQFIAPAGALPVWLQFVVLGAVVNVIFSLGDVVAFAIAATVKAGAAGNARCRRAFEWIAGTALMGLGLRLAAERG